MTNRTDQLDHARVGKIIAGKYSVVRLLGAGGMGAVYEAQNTWTRRRVAIKVMRPEIASDTASVGRFMQEAQTTAQLEHPNIVDVLDMGQEPSDGSLFIVQEFLTGYDLAHRLEHSGPMAPREAVRTILPIADALVTAHARGIVHRDLKPDNIFLARGRSGETVPKLIDFGLSKVLSTDPQTLRKTTTGAVMGTPYYMSPEQARGERSIDGRTDVWSLGAVLYEALSGHTPFEADNYNLLIVKILTQTATPLARVAPHLPADLIEIVHRTLEPQREKRPTMREFRDALARCSVATRSSSDALPVWSPGADAEPTSPAVPMPDDGGPTVASVPAFVPAFVPSPAPSPAAPSVPSLAAPDADGDAEPTVAAAAPLLEVRAARQATGLEWSQPAEAAASRRRPLAALLVGAALLLGGGATVVALWMRPAAHSAAHATAAPPAAPPAATGAREAAATPPAAPAGVVAPAPTPVADAEAPAPARPAAAARPSVRAAHPVHAAPRTPRPRSTPTLAPGGVYR